MFSIALDSVCFILRLHVFPCYFVARVGRVFSLFRSLFLPFPFRFLPFHPSSRSLVFTTVISITTLYATLIIVGVMSSRKSSKTRQPRRVSDSYLFPSHSRNSLSASALSFSFSLVNSSTIVSKGSSLPSLPGWIPRESPRHRALPRS